MEVDRFKEKLNKIDGNVYVIEEVVQIANGVYEGELLHDNVNASTLTIYTGPKLTGERIQSYVLSTPSMMPWKRMIRIYTDVPRVYISYETDGDTVEAEDINKVQEAVIVTQKAVNSEVVRAEAAEKTLADDLSAEVRRATGAEQKLTADLSAEVTRSKVAEKTLTDNLSAEVTRAKTAEQILDTDMGTEASRAQAAEKVLTDSLSAEAARAKAAEKTLTDSLAAETTRAKAAEKINADNLTAETARARAREDGIAADLAGETSRAISSERALAEDLAVETTRAKAAEKTLTDNLTAETARAEAKETEISGNLSSEITRAKAAEKTLTDNIATEVTRAKGAEKTLMDNLAAEVTRSKGAEKTLTDNLSAEVTRAKAAEKTNADAITAEASRGQAAEGAIRETVSAHVNNKSNPHGVTKAQAGLGNVPNVSTNDQTPTFTQAATLANIASGEKLTVMLGKIAKALADFIAHKADNVLHITATERTNWNDANSKKHTHTNKSIIDKFTQAMLDKLSGIAAGAEVNVQADWNVVDENSDAYIKNKPTAMPASDVLAWAKAANKPAYSWSEITSKPSTFTPSSHNHTKNQITDMPTKVSQFTNDAGYITQADVDTSQSHTHTNKLVLDKITQAMLDKLAGIAEGANKYVHPNTAGNKHIPAGGASGQILRWSAAGTAVWGTDNNTTYSVFKAATASAAGGTGLVPAPAAGAQIKYLRGDGSWQTPPDTKYVHSNSGVTAGEYQSVIVNAQGHVTGGVPKGAFTWAQLKGAYTWGQLKGGS